jgi:hypothetical protein
LQKLYLRSHITSVCKMISGVPSSRVRLKSRFRSDFPRIVFLQSPNTIILYYKYIYMLFTSNFLLGLWDRPKIVPRSTGRSRSTRWTGLLYFMRYNICERTEKCQCYEWNRSDSLTNKQTN